MKTFTDLQINPMDKIKQTANTLLEAVVDRDEIEMVEVADHDDYVQVTIKVKPDSIGKVIGKEGKMVKTLRTLLKIVAYKEMGKKLTLDIAKP